LQIDLLARLTICGTVFDASPHFETNPAFTFNNHNSVSEANQATNPSFDHQHNQLLELCNLVAQQQPPFALQQVVQPFDLVGFPPPTPSPHPASALFTNDQPDYSLLASLYPTSPGPSTLSNELQLDTSDLTFWSAFLSPPVLPARPLPATAPPTLPPNRRPRPSRLLPSGNGIATRYGSPTLEEDGPVTADERAWPMRWTPTETDSALHVDQPVESIGLAQLLPASLEAPPPFDEASKMCILETIRSAQLTDYEYHALVSFLMTEIGFFMGLTEAGYVCSTEPCRGPGL